MNETARTKGGLYGAFAVRNPVGKGLGLVAAIALLFGCWQASRYMAGPVGWADKSLYVETAWDGLVDPVLRLIPVFELGREKPYAVIVERAPGWPLYTNEARAAGRPYAVHPSEVPAKLLHQCLRLYVYGGSFWRQVWPLWIVWPFLLIGCLVGGQLWDMRRLRIGRQKGVHLRGNRLVDGREWNNRANEDA